MTYSFTRTREEMAVLVLGKLGVLAAGETASAEDATLVYEAIDLRLKEMHRRGIYWRNVGKRTLSFTIPANVASASASVDILYPVAMYIVNTSLDDPVEIIGAKEYAAIDNKSYAGPPEKVLYVSSAEFLFWPVPTSNTTAKVLYEQIADDTAASTTPDVDVSMLRWLKDIIAYDLADHFGLPEQKVMRFAQEAERAERNIRSLNSERKDYEPVAVDDWTGMRHSTRTDYQW